MKHTVAHLGWVGVAVALVGAAVLASAQEWRVERREGSPAVVERYQEVLDANPLSGPALEGLLRAYAPRGGLEALIAHYARRASEHPDDASAHLVLARLRLRANDPEAALPAVERALDLLAASADILALRGRIRGHLGDAQGAIEDFERAIEGAGDRQTRIALSRELGDVYLALDLPERAAEAYRRMAREAPRDRWVRGELAHILYEAGLREAALEELRTVVRLAGTSTRDRADALREVARLEEELGLYEEALASWQGVRELVGPRSWLHEAALEGMVRTYRAWGRLEDLLEELDARLARHGRDRFALLTRARVLAELGREEESVAALRLAQQRLGRDREVALELGRLLSRLGRVDEAVEVLQVELQARPRDFTLLTALVELQVEAGRHFDASYAMRQYQERHWDGLAELWELFTLYQHIGDARAAGRVGARIRELSPDDPRPQLRLAESALAGGQVAEGLALLTELAAEAEAGPAVHRDVILLLRDQGLSEEAEAALRLARERFPSDGELAALWLQGVRTGGAETVLAAAREVLLLTDRWDLVAEAFELYHALVAEADLAGWAIEHYQARFDQAPTDYRLGRLVLMLRLAEGDIGGATRTLAALEVAAPSPSRAEEWTLATLRRWPSPEALPLLRRLADAGNGRGDWRVGLAEARALISAGRWAEARERLDSLSDQVGDRAAGRFAVGEVLRELPDPRDRDRGCRLIVQALTQEPRRQTYRLEAIDCLVDLDKPVAALDLAIDGLRLVRAVEAAEPLWERLLRARAATRGGAIGAGQLADRLREALAGRDAGLRAWLEERLEEL